MGISRYDDRIFPYACRRACGRTCTQPGGQCHRCAMQATAQRHRDQGFQRHGRAHCPLCGAPITKRAIQCRPCKALAQSLAAQAVRRGTNAATWPPASPGAGPPPIASRNDS
jgi:hypothetical protein